MRFALRKQRQVAVKKLNTIADAKKLDKRGPLIGIGESQETEQDLQDGDPDVAKS